MILLRVWNVTAVSLEGFYDRSMTRHRTHWRPSARSAIHGSYSPHQPGLKIHTGRALMGANAFPSAPDRPFGYPKGSCRTIYIEATSGPGLFWCPFWVAPGLGRQLWAVWHQRLIAATGGLPSSWIQHVAPYNSPREPLLGTPTTGLTHTHRSGLTTLRPRPS